MEDNMPINLMLIDDALISCIRVASGCCDFGTTK